MLLAIANAEGLTVEPQEVDLVLQKMAASTGQDFHSIKDYYEQHNLMIPLKDRVLADKAMDIIYSSAQVSTVPSRAGESARWIFGIAAMRRSATFLLRLRVQSLTNRASGRAKSPSSGKY